MVYVKYREITLGKLEYSNNTYIYTTYPENISAALANGYPVYLYFMDKDFVDLQLPNCLKNFLPNKDTELYQSSGIVDSDNDYQKLIKVAAQDLYDQELYISTKY